MILTYKYRLRLKPDQEKRINQWIGTCRYIYNVALYLKKDAYSKSISLSFNDLKNQLTTIKDVDWIKDVPSQSLQATIEKLQRTYKNFFKRGAGLSKKSMREAGFPKKSKRRVGFPKFKSKKKANSIFFKSVEYMGLNSFRLPKIGVLKTFNDRQPKGIPKTASIIKELDKFYLCVQCEVETKASKPCDKQTGIDVGISNFAVLSDGTFVEHPMFLTNSLRHLRRAQRKLSRARLRSKNWYKKVAAVKKLHQKVRRKRQDFLQKPSTAIVQGSDMISLEDLNISGMLQSNLSRQISDSGWGYFKQMLRYKCELYQKTFVEVAPQYTSQECFICGHISKNNRKTQDKFLCENCGHENHADLNASQNILRRGQRLLTQSSGQ